jgi:catechol 2,3-dioxygenase-like lactoylglutathione lyase family enzyme
MALFAGINVVPICVPDRDQARVFYRDVLGLGEPVYDLPDAGWKEFPGFVTFASFYDPFGNRLQMCSPA